MKLQFTHHAEYRIFYERNVSSEDIKKVINNPDTSENIQDSLLKSEKKLKNKTLVVVYSKNKKSEYIIVTAYFK